jgi:hypothetical protein
VVSAKSGPIRWGGDTWSAAARVARPRPARAGAGPGRGRGRERTAGPRGGVRGRLVAGAAGARTLRASGSGIGMRISGTTMVSGHGNGSKVDYSRLIEGYDRMVHLSMLLLLCEMSGYYAIVLFAWRRFYCFANDEMLMLLRTPAERVKAKISFSYQKLVLAVC